MIDFLAIDSSQHPIAPLIRIFMRSLPLLRPVDATHFERQFTSPAWCVETMLTAFSKNAMPF